MTTLAGLCCLLAAASVLFAARRVLGTTLVAPCGWTVAALTALAIVLLALPGTGAEVSHARYAAGVLTFAPLMAVLGAKRPQHRAWQWIVLSLLVVLLMPSLEWLAYHPGAELHVGGLRRWFVDLLIALGLLNYLATRFWPSAVLAAGGQGLLLGGHLGLGTLLWQQAPAWSYSAGAICVSAAAGLAAAGLPRTGRERSLSRSWLDFRDAYGSLWGLRLSLRFNATAAHESWPIQLAWSGLVTDRGDSAEPLEADLRQQVQPVLDNLWLRFVSPDWLAARTSRE